MPDVSTPEPEVADDLKARLAEIASELSALSDNLPTDKGKRAAVNERLASLKKEVEAIGECIKCDAEDLESIKSVRKARRRRLGIKVRR